MEISLINVNSGIHVVGRLYSQPSTSSFLLLFVEGGRFQIPYEKSTCDHHRISNVQIKFNQVKSEGNIICSDK